MKKFKTKKKKNKLVLYVLVFLLSIVFSIHYIYKKNLINSDTIVDYMLNINLDKLPKNIKDINDVDVILKYALNLNDSEFVLSNKEESEKLEVNTEINEEINNSNSDNDNSENNDNNAEIEELEKIVYIYNTHQEEKYKSTYLEAFNITPTVLMASKMLKEYLEDLGIGVIVEERNVANKLKEMNLKYSGSYKATREFMESAFKENPSLKYFIDLHRDSSVYDKTTTSINGESYAKLLLIVGLENPNYKPNLELAEKIKNKIVNVDSSLFRTIYKKSGTGVNGIYNQDFNQNTMLIEVGGQYNNISEVNNTLKVLAQILAEYIKEDNNA